MKPRVLLLGAVLLAYTVLPIAAQLYGDRANGWMMVDFRAYYCAALVERHHADPYLANPLHDCERAAPAPFYRAPRGVTVPAPYPPYALALIAPFTLVPFATAAALWWILLALCCIVAAAALARVTQLSFFVAWAALALSLGLASFPSGQIVPVCIVALLAAAFSAQRGNFGVAALAIGLAMIEPHIALPAAIAFFVRYKSGRVVLVLSFALLAMLSLVFGGVAQNIEYLTSVLPAHALSEVSRDNQYSLSTVVASFGVPDAQAVLAGSISYAIMIVLGVLVALRLARRYYEPAFVVLIPPALALLGGTFVHTVEMAAAVPACLLLYARAEEYRKALLIPLLLLAVPWMSATSAALMLAPIFPIAYLAYVLCGRRRSLALTAGLASFIAIVVLFIIASHSAPNMHAVHAAHPSIDPRLAEASWRAFVLGDSSNRPIMWLLRWPTWIGLLTFGVGAIWFSRKPKAGTFMGAG
ncbi:MAG: glycosyltransferase family 87 protein [Vulcanimicrobiaceae bacterium]